MRVELTGHLLPDPAVRGVERLLASDGPRRFVRDLAAVLEIEQQVVLEIVKQRVGQRALLRIEAESPRGKRCWYAKLHRRAMPGSERELDLLVRISQEAKRVGVHVPVPLAYLPRFRAIVFGAAAGSALLPCCAPRSDRPARGDAMGADPIEQIRIFRAVGEAIARLHGALPRPGVVKGQEFEREQIERARESLLEHRPELRERFGAALEDWWSRRGAALPSEPSPPVALHGDFYPAQILVEAGIDDAQPGLAIIDWDGLCTGDAERDAGNFETHLLLEGLRGHLSAEEAELRVEAFRSGYRAVRPLHPGLLAWYRRATLLRLAALYADPAFGPSPPNAPDLAERLLASR